MDTDVLLIKAIPEINDDLYGWQDVRQINNAVLYLSGSSPTLRDLIEYTQTEYPIPPFFNKEIQKELADAQISGQPVHVSQMPWGVWGPAALTYFVKKNGFEYKAQPVEVFYPVHFNDAHIVLTAGYDVEAKFSDRTLAIHLWNAKLKKPLYVERGSYFDKFCRAQLGLKVSI